MMKPFLNKVRRYGRRLALMDTEMDQNLVSLFGLARAPNNFRPPEVELFVPENMPRQRLSEGVVQHSSLISSQ